jgi:hypothetical protein
MEKIADTAINYCPRRRFEVSLPSVVMHAVTVAAPTVPLQTPQT